MAYCTESRRDFKIINTLLIQNGLPVPGVPRVSYCDKHYTLVAELKQGSEGSQRKVWHKAEDSWVLEYQLFIQRQRSIPIFPHGCTCAYWPKVSLAHIASGSLPFPTRVNAHEVQGFCDLFFPPNEPAQFTFDRIHPQLCTWHQLLLIHSQFDLKVQQSK